MTLEEAMNRYDCDDAVPVLITEINRLRDALKGAHVVTVEAQRRAEDAERSAAQVMRNEEAAQAEVERLRKLYQEWGYADVPCPKHSKTSLLAGDCASCRAEAAEAEVKIAQNSWQEWMRTADFERARAKAGEAEVERLREALTNKQNFADTAVRVGEMWEGKAERLGADRDRFRKALERIIQAGDYSNFPQDARMYAIAREALREQP